MTTTDNWRTKTMILGGVIGALIGVGAAYLLARTAEESGGGPPKITTSDAIKSAIGIVGLVRGIASLGDR